MTSPYLGQIMMFGGNFAPVGWALCNGQLMNIDQNTALYAVIGTTYGGDGQTTFALPNLQSRLPIHQGQGLGLSSYVIGQNAGTQYVTLPSGQMTSHTHAFMASTTNASLNTIASNAVPATPTVGSPAHFYAVPGTPPLTFYQMASNVLGNAGGSQPHANQMPSLCVSFCIALVGVYPTRN
jgi:microcystin-dependent protein